MIFAAIAGVIIVAPVLGLLIDQRARRRRQRLGDSGRGAIGLRVDIGADRRRNPYGNSRR